MDIILADERVLLLKEQLSIDHAEGRAWTNKTDAFGTVSRMTSLLQRPKDEDFQLVYREHRYQPFWHIECNARYIYERTREYPVEVGGPEVHTLTIEGKDYDVAGGTVILTGLEHCREEPHQVAFLDGLTSISDLSLAGYLEFPSTEIPMDELDDFAPEDAIVVPPQARASAVVHEVLAGMIRTVQADRILEDRVEVERADLYYRPVYAFRYRWISKDREGVIEYDALTGKVEAGGKTFQQYMGRFLDPEFLFDLGVDTADLVLPGGGMAVKLARRGIDVARSKARDASSPGG